MKTLKFKCTLLSDVILNVKTATEGNNSTLDFIPGNNFLGIVAKEYDGVFKQEQIEVFHSGKVRFGDAHPIVDGYEQLPSDRPLRSLHIPASMYHPKLVKASEECYIHHFYVEDSKNPKQLKQCRSGYYAFKDNAGYPAKTETSFAIKSAYNRELRRAEDEKMYGFESLDAGAAFLFEVQCDNDALADKIKENLIGKRNIGRSKTAQYGLVEIKEQDYEDCKGDINPFNITEKKKDGDKEIEITGQYIAVYADSRLIFLDEYGNPTFQPTAKALGLDEDGVIDWQKSQIRTFQYAPWNFKRQCRDTDRCGIEKGSVFIVKTDKPANVESQYVGSYNNEGFGKIIYNPDFLKPREGSENGEAACVINELPKEKKTEAKEVNSTEPLILFLKSKRAEDKENNAIMTAVNKFVDDKKGLFRGDTFASQWGEIRKIAMTYTDEDELILHLFGILKGNFTKEVTNLGALKFKKPGKEGREQESWQADPSKGYLTHGTAKPKWDERRRLTSLFDFVKEIKFAKELPLRKTLINLASEMGKAVRNL